MGRISKPTVHENPDVAGTFTLDSRALRISEEKSRENHFYLNREGDSGSLLIVSNFLDDTRPVLQTF